jgi:hypothetical protein
MHSGNLTKTALLAFFLVAAFTGIWEMYWRSRGFQPSFNDDKVLWADTRREVYAPSDQATVFIGPSRIEFDLDIPTWKKLTGEKAVQLAIVGTSPRLILKDLAEDEKFKGKLVIDATEFSLFSNLTRRERSSFESLEYYRDETPSQSASAAINFALESRLVFLEEGKFGLNALLNKIVLPSRKGVFVRPAFPVEFTTCDRQRQTVMTPMFLENQRLLDIQKNNWRKIRPTDSSFRMNDAELMELLDQVRAWVDRIRSRGGQVVFVRPPSSGSFLQEELQTYPRKDYWDRLLNHTGTKGFYFSDYPETASFVCPEESHLSPADARIYTAHLVGLLKKEAGWQFKNQHHN